VLLWTGDRSPIRGCTTTKKVQVPLGHFLTYMALNDPAITYEAAPRQAGSNASMTQRPDGEQQSPGPTAGRGSSAAAAVSGPSTYERSPAACPVTAHRPGHVPERQENDTSQLAHPARRAAAQAARHRSLRPHEDLGQGRHRCVVRAMAPFCGLAAAANWCQTRQLRCCLRAQAKEPGMTKREASDQLVELLLPCRVGTL
jgi:hypothetical protein